MTGDANSLGRRAGRDVEVGGGVKRRVGKWRIEVGMDVPERQGTNLLVGPRGPWLQWVLRRGITYEWGLLLACSGQYEPGCFPSKLLHDAVLERALLADGSRDDDRRHCDSGARLCLLGS